MKITKYTLKQLIREELGAHHRPDDPVVFGKLRPLGAHHTAARTEWDRTPSVEEMENMTDEELCIISYDTEDEGLRGAAEDILADRGQSCNYLEESKKLTNTALKQLVKEELRAKLLRDVHCERDDRA